jgi:hypothetical protein
MASVFAIAACASNSQRVQSLKATAKTDNYAVWITLLKGFGQNVYYVGSDESNTYFRIGAIFRSYYKVPSCAAHPPEVFPLLESKAYSVKFHVNSSNKIDGGSTCSPPVSYSLGNLDRA